MRTIKSNRLPLILKPKKMGTKYTRWIFNNGKDELEKSLYNKNRSEIATKINVILKDKFEEKSLDQTNSEEKIFV